MAVTPFLLSVVLLRRQLPACWRSDCADLMYILMMMLSEHPIVFSS
jgi:hypothetical protein